jgi:hypothetical protein
VFPVFAWASAMTSAAISPNVGMGLAAVWAALSAVYGVTPLLDHTTGVSRSLAGLLEADFRIRAEAHIPPNAVHLVAQNPGFLSAWSDDEHKAVAIPIPAFLCSSDAEFSQFAHISPTRSPTRSPTLCSRLGGTRGDKQRRQL